MSLSIPRIMHIRLRGSFQFGLSGVTQFRLEQIPGLRRSAQQRVQRRSGRSRRSFNLQALEVQCAISITLKAGNAHPKRNLFGRSLMHAFIDCLSCTSHEVPGHGSHVYRRDMRARSDSEFYSPARRILVEVLAILSIMQKRGIEASASRQTYGVHVVRPVQTSAASLVRRQDQELIGVETRSFSPEHGLDIVIQVGFRHTRRSLDGSVFARSETVSDCHACTSRWLNTKLTSTPRPPCYSSGHCRPDYLRSSGVRADPWPSLPPRLSRDDRWLPDRDAAPRDGDDHDQWVKDMADALPPLTDRQRDSLARLLRTPRRRAA
jgi:hypothetical protein